MSKHLITNPAGVFFREAVVTGSAYILELYLLNTGNANLTISAIALTTGTRFTWLFPTDSPTQTLPFTLAPKVNFKLLMTFDPATGEEDTENTDTLTITHDGDNTPNTLAITGWNRPGGNPRLKLSPSAWSFDWVDGRDLTAGTPFGQQTNVLNLTLGNSGDKVLTLTGMNINAPALEMEPRAIFPIVLAPGSGYTFHFAATSSFVGLAQYNDSIEFISDAPSSPDDYVIALTGLAVTSAYNLTGAGLTPFFGFTATIRQATLSSFDTEETTTLKRVHSFGESGVEKTLYGVRFKYEDWGVATVTVQAKVSTTDSVTGASVVKTVTKAVTFGTAGADQFVKTVFVPLQVEGELIEIQFSRVSTGGRVVITEYTPVYDDWSQMLSLGNLPAVVSAFSTTGTPLLLFAFGATIRQMGTSLDTEEAGSLSWQRNIQDPGNEKTLSKVLMKYEDIGSVTVTVTDKTKRQTVGPISLALGNITNDKFVYPAEFDLINSDELHLITIARAAAGGALSIVELNPGIAQRGVTVKE